MRVRTKKGVACTFVSTTDSEHISPGYTLCFKYLLNSRSDMVAGWRCGHLKSMCMCEFGSAHCIVDVIDAHCNCIEFALANSVTEPVCIRIQCEQALSAK